MERQSPLRRSVPRPMTGSSSSANAAAAALVENFRGPVLLPGDPTYEIAREIWNADINRHPGVIARCTQVADVVEAVRVAGQYGLEVSVRGGGHNIAGTALCDGGMMIDMSLLKHVRVDPIGRQATASPGLTWGELDSASQSVGLATPGGVVSTTGIAGLTLGGGFGWLSRRHGWSCDNLLSIEMVTATGEVIRADSDENGELFWGARGGGGNFGIVTSFVFQLHPVNGVYAGFLLYELERASEVLRHCRDLMHDAADEFCLVIGIGNAPPVAGLPADLRTARVLRIGFCHSGPIDDGRSAVDSITRAHQPVFAQFGPMAYRELQTMLDAGARFGLAHYSKSHFLAELSDEAIDTLVQHARQPQSPRSRVVLHTCGGAASRRSEDATAFGHRDALYNLQIDATWEPTEDGSADVAWAKEFGAAMQPFSNGGTYVNFLSDAADRTGVQAAYRGGKYRRLQELKTLLDPGNFFHHNQNVPPLQEVAS
ncbi:FAD-binding oxidoreductase [Krasilnikovia sp. M28-CT-15]|uniref:FAD-binding oxidoreductase n=1 Tax=Krasilnikovia sp. M28-CT-15 TaxID=3373540 RepID=UPI003876D4CC